MSPTHTSIDRIDVAKTLAQNKGIEQYPELATLNLTVFRAGDTPTAIHVNLGLIALLEYDLAERNIYDTSVEDLAQEIYDRFLELHAQENVQP